LFKITWFNLQVSVRVFQEGSVVVVVIKGEEREASIV
jgi:hypothetical protein